MENQPIQKVIYDQPGVSRRLRRQWWAVACVAVGALSAYLLVALPGVGAGMSALLVGLLAIGVFGLLTLLCFYTFGDKFTPVYGDSRIALERYVDYYPATARQSLLAALEGGDVAALRGIKKSIVPQLVLVRYLTPDESVWFAQLSEDNDGEQVPVSPVFHSQQ